MRKQTAFVMIAQLAMLLTMPFGVLAQDPTATPVPVPSVLTMPDAPAPAADGLVVQVATSVTTQLVVENRDRQFALFRVHARS